MNKIIFNLAIDAINNDVNYKMVIKNQVKDMKIYLEPFNFEVIWNVITSGVEFKEIFTDSNDEDEFNELLDNMNEIFEYDLTNMSQDDKYCAGFDIASIIIKNPIMDKFEYNKELKIFEYNESTSN